MGNTRVEEIMTKKPFIIEEDESLGAVLAFLDARESLHLPIVREGKRRGNCNHLRYY